MKEISLSCPACGGEVDFCGWEDGEIDLCVCGKFVQLEKTHSAEGPTYEVRLCDQ